MVANRTVNSEFANPLLVECCFGGNDIPIRFPGVSKGYVWSDPETGSCFLKSAEGGGQRDWGDLTRLFGRQESWVE